MGKIISNGIEYSGIQGTTVIPNPEGSPTDELSSIQIGSDIYSIAGGGVGGDILIKDRDWTLLADTYGTTQLAKTYDYYLFIIIQQGNDAYGLRLEDAHIIDSTVVDLESADRLYYSKAWKDNRGAYTTSGVEILPTEITLYSDATQTVSCKLYGANAQSGGGGSASWKDITGTLTAGETSISFTDSSILESSTFDFYTSKFGVNPTDVSVLNGSITLTFDEQSTDLGVKVRVS